MIKFIDFINESSVNIFSFTHDGKVYNFEENTKKEVFIKVIDWLSSMGYSFRNNTGQTYYPNILDEIPTGHRLTHYHRIPSTNRYVDINFIKQFQSLISLLKDFGIDSKSIKFNSGADIELGETPSAEKEGEENETEEIEKPKIYVKNKFGGRPMSSALLVLGESGAGKSTTIENILDSEGHYSEFIIPTAATTGLLAQFSPLKQKYVVSRLGRMLIEASKTPQGLYTAVFDEMHKSNVIEMINDELLQAISKKRNRGERFISLDDDTAEVYQDSELEINRRGNILIPDNFGFIFISSKPALLLSNPDFANRVDIVFLKSYEEEIVKTSEELLSKILSPEDRDKLINKRND